MRAQGPNALCMDYHDLNSALQLVIIYCHMLKTFLQLSLSIPWWDSNIFIDSVFKLTNTKYKKLPLIIVVVNVEVKVVVEDVVVVVVIVEVVVVVEMVGVVDMKVVVVVVVVMVVVVVVVVTVV